MAPAHALGAGVCQLQQRAIITVVWVAHEHSDTGVVTLSSALLATAVVVRMPSWRTICSDACDGAGSEKGRHEPCSDYSHPAVCDSLCPSVSASTNKVGTESEAASNAAHGFRVFALISTQSQALILG